MFAVSPPLRLALPHSFAAWLVLTTLRGQPHRLRVYSEPTPTTMLGERTWIVAKAKGKTFAEAKKKVDRWWRHRQPFQKRALLQNALVPYWTPPEV
jgi:hypothetical protein